MARYINADELAIKIGALDLYGTDDRNRLITWHPEQNSIPYVLITDVLNAVYSQPTADVVERKRGEWIPCSERLPDNDDIMLVSCRTKKGVNSVNRAYYADGFWHGSGSMSGVTAWMLLPEPYTKENDRKGN